MVEAETELSESESEEGIPACPKKKARVNSLMEDNLDDEEAALAGVIGLTDYLDEFDHDDGLDHDNGRASGEEDKLDSDADQLDEGEDIEMENGIEEDFGDFGGVGNGVSVVLFYFCVHINYSE
jgi:hypothetical protein